MTPERWKQIYELVEAALDRGGEERVAFLDEACAGDDELRREVESLISYQRQASKFLEEPAFKHATDLFSDPQTEIESMEGQTISHYSILRKLGAGGMGEVYLALDTALNRKVAIKFLSQNSVNSEQARKRLVREARAAAALDLVMRAHCVPALPGPQYREAPASSTCLHFGQSQAFADFDGDHRLDLATLTWVGRNKSLEICLSRTKARTLVHFSTQSAQCGSLFTKDIDSDGDNDLVWTDLLHPDDVVVWLDDGAGRFERVCPGEHAAEFVLTDGPVCVDSKDAHQDFAFRTRRDPSIALPRAQTTNDFDRITEFREKQPRRSIVPFAFRIPFDRGPPALI